MTTKHRKFNGLKNSEFIKNLVQPPSNSMNDSLDDLRLLGSLISTPGHLFSTDDGVIASGYAKKILHLLNSQRNDPSLCDYEVIVDGQTFNCHKCVLISISEFFRIMLTSSMKESRENFVILKGFRKTDGMERILDFIYTGSIHITFENILNTLAFASHLQIETLLDLCSQFLLNNLTYSNCVYILKIADFYMLQAVMNLAQSFVSENIIAIYEQASEQFIQLSYQNLKIILDGEFLKCLSDLDLFLMLVKWIQAPAGRLLNHYKLDSQKNPRLSYAKDLLKSVRFMCMSADELCDWVETVPFMNTIPECKEYLTEAYRWHALSRRQPLIDSEQARLRGQDVLIAVGETNIFALNEQKAQWDIVASAPLDENYPYPFSVITVNNYLYVIGTRRSSSEEYRACYRFSPRTLEWTQLAPLVKDRSRFGIAYIENYIYIFGGFEGFKRTNRVYISTIDRYSIALDMWEEFSSDGPIMSCMASCSHNQKIYFGGGKNMNWSKIADFYSVNINEKQIDKKAKMLTARTTHQITAVGDQIYALGGFDDAGNGILSIESYDIEKNQWSVLTYIPGKISKTWPQSIGVFNNSRFYISVFTTPNTFKIVQKGYYYDIKSNIWSEAPVIAERARYCPTTCVVFPQSVYNFDNRTILRLNHKKEEYNTESERENENLKSSVVSNNSFYQMLMDHLSQTSNGIEVFFDHEEENGDIASV